MKANFSIQDYQHFSFDLWLTVIKSHYEFKTKRAELFKSFFKIDKPFDDVMSTVKYYDNLCNTSNEIVGGNIETFEIYLMILSSLKVDLKTLNMKLFEDFYIESEQLFLKYHPQIIMENVHGLFEEIKSAGKTINILSNTGFIKGKTMRKFLHHQKLDQYIDFQIYSDEIRFSKPNPEVFKAVLNQIKNKNILPEKILHIGDNLVADYNGARDFGFSAYLIQN
ncbi:phosphoglycolate phosphatase [Chryseobacterium sp. Leaf180]|uniref:HAD family hydrolase n=1 Tax=Chryseobacterium sp. Leaf180 TaxID=1736289 RepID=UPI0006FA71D3|nr:HAD family hydrolase [Chryseobacterium sp. Leaf180]KQR92705.1 phosphoglycolate phosphatase [Chryseobacterium sp. Leaf180]